MLDNPFPCKEKEDKLPCHECFYFNLTRSSKIFIFEIDGWTLKKISPEAKKYDICIIIQLSINSTSGCRFIKIYIKLWANNWTYQNNNILQAKTVILNF